MDLHEYIEDVKIRLVEQHNADLSADGKVTLADGIYPCKCEPDGRVEQIEIKDGKFQLMGFTVEIG